MWQNVTPREESGHSKRRWLVFFTPSWGFGREAVAP
jgi:hypothetical protein